VRRVVQFSSLGLYLRYLPKASGHDTGCKDDPHPGGPAAGGQAGHSNVNKCLYSGNQYSEAKQQMKLTAK